MLKKLDDCRWEVPRTGGMKVPGIIYSSERLLRDMGNDESQKQVANVAHLPGIVNYSLAMPDVHWGYGFPIGGVAAFDAEHGIISPGGVGYDINCGCRLMTTRLAYEEIQGRLPELVTALFRNIPSGVGAKGDLKLSVKEEKKVLEEGAAWAVRQGFGTAADLETTEDGGCMAGADPELVSDRALERGREQLGTLGSGNHFLEIEVVEEIFDPQAAAAFGLELNQVVVMIHSGSRGLGYQVCDDYLAGMVKHVHELGFSLPDRQLACAYLKDRRGQDYYAAMAAAANYAWANRQLLMHWTRETFEKTLHKSPREVGMKLLYDVCHNIAKLEIHPVAGREMRLCVHRKGATRALPPGHPAVPPPYREVGQPVLIPGNMGTGSYVLAGTQRAYAETFASACHGAGRVMSRSQAMKASRGRAIVREMAELGVTVMAGGRGTLSEEIPGAYKNLEEVVAVVHRAGLARKVARLRAVGCIKG
ncbi:MAG TPA: RtcB family protein [Syntrophales bacterium]|jgi:tRNA-splicing ligase RtcB|nr:RtcB family protein [Syntrophales bacterium]HON23602.1 RtcB family protein [Syntrophales bacterium]HOU76929.1 RtcB family protein [Syntrophales bacterium]HPC31698.1 RtcB family protein [Syntrophales bacterium]HQG34593.1 RtcB family protein [Syntrophales bacterium]